MNVVVKNPESLKRIFNTSVEKAKYSAENLAELLGRLAVLGNECVGMRVSLGGASFVVHREGATLRIPEHTDQWGLFLRGLQLSRLVFLRQPGREPQVHAGRSE